jgi:hypothetical protein
MDDRNIRRLTRATRVQAFGRVNATDFTLESRTTALFGDLDPILAEFTAARVGQLRGPVGKRVLLDALATDFKDIARTARAIKLDDSTFPDTDYRHPLTAAETPISTHADALLKLLEDNTTGIDTQAQINAKAVLRARFIAYELPAGFVEDLRADRDALDTCNSGKHSDILEGVESTSTIDSLLGQAQGIITRLDAAIQNKYSRDPDKLTAWKSACHTERAAKKADASVTPPLVS